MKETEYMADKREEWEEIKRNEEHCVVDTLAKKAERQGWMAEIRHGNETGIDLKLKKGQRTIIIEAKGAREGSKNAKSRVEAALGAIIMDMEDEDPARVYRYCVAFPKHVDFPKQVARIPLEPRKGLRLNILMVDCTQKLVNVCLPDAADETELNEFALLFDTGVSI